MPLRKFANMLRDYHLLWLIGMSMAAWIGSRIIQPLNQVSENAKALTALTRHIEVKDSIDNDWQEVLKIVVRVQCATLSTTDKYKYNLCQHSVKP